MRRTAIVLALLAALSGPAGADMSIKCKHALDAITRTTAAATGDVREQPKGYTEIPLNLPMPEAEASLSCDGKLPPLLTAKWKSGDPPPTTEWFAFVAQAGSIITGAPAEEVIGVVNSCMSALIRKTSAGKDPTFVTPDGSPQFTESAVKEGIGVMCLGGTSEVRLGVVIAKPHNPGR